MTFENHFTRREFLKLSGMFAGAMALPRIHQFSRQALAQYPEGANLGRVCAGDIGAWFDLKTEPNMNAPTAGTVWRDDVLEIKREVVANSLDFNRYNQRWMETPAGYLYSPYVQPVKNIVNVPVQTIPIDGEGKPGMWVEISAPVVDITPTRLPASSYWIRTVAQPRVYYSQIFWAYDLRQANGKTEYLLTQKYGAEPDSYWVDASACRPLTREDTDPIHPGMGDKYIKVDLNYQTLSCLEGGREVYFCDVSTGGIVNGTWLTPQGVHTIWRKIVSVHMSAGGLWGFDSPGIGWTTFFHSDGAAIHSTYWHNNFGTALSHGCVNCRPADAQWIWRWTKPAVGYYPGELTVQGGANSTRVEVFS